MRHLIQQFGLLRLVALAVTSLPLLLLPILGTLWLWQSSAMLYWLLAVILATAFGAVLNRVAVSRDQQALPDTSTTAAAHWPEQAERCWGKVERFADEATTAQWPLGDGAALMKLAREILVMVADHFHPGNDKPLLQMTLPHTLTIIERAARELRDDVVTHIPFSHRLTLGAMARAKRWKDLVKQHEGWYRAARALFAPQSALVGELRRAVGNQLMDHGSERIQNWLLREYIRKLGYHAIDLYGGLVRIDDNSALDAPDQRSASDHEVADGHQTELRNEPLRILLLGRANAGKSSLINALFGQLSAATDVLPDTTSEVVPYRLERDGVMQALIFDTPGFDGPVFGGKVLQRTALDADLILWVSAANRADRSEERVQLDRLRTLLTDPARRAPPILVVMSHIDRLRPLREWQPPYVLNPPQGTKAEQIHAAATALAGDLGVPVERIIPVCLAEHKSYNVDDALWAAMLSLQDEAGRVRLLRCLRARKREENWSLLWEQLRGAGRVLRSLPERVRSGAVHSAPSERARQDDVD